MNFSDKLKELRLKNNETQQELASKLKAALAKEDIDVTVVDELIEVLNQIPDAVKVTFKDLEDVKKTFELECMIPQ